MATGTRKRKCNQIDSFDTKKPKHVLDDESSSDVFKKTLNKLDTDTLLRYTAICYWDKEVNENKRRRDKLSNLIEENCKEIDKINQIYKERSTNCKRVLFTDSLSTRDDYIKKNDELMVQIKKYNSILSVSETLLQRCKEEII